MCVRPLSLPCRYTRLDRVVRFRFACVTRATRVRRLLRVARCSPSYMDTALGWRFSPDIAFGVAQHVAALQHIWNLAPLPDCMARNHLTMRWSERPPVVRPRFP
jgi:hypothetical protein